MVTKRDGTIQQFDFNKIRKAVKKACKSVDEPFDLYIDKALRDAFTAINKKQYHVEEIQDIVEETLFKHASTNIARAYAIYRDRHVHLREYTSKKLEFINNYKKASNTANATIDDNSNVANKNIGILNAEIHKEDNIQISRRMIVDKLKQLYPLFDAKQYIKDLEHHIIYKHDESSFAGAIAPYCVSASMYPFLLNGIKDIGGLSAKPKNLDSFCGMYVNFIFAVSAMFAGAVATPEFLVCFDYFAKKEWGEDYYLYPNRTISTDSCSRSKTIISQIHQYWQQIIYSINQPSAARGLQSAFVNFAYFDKYFFEGMFDNFYFPDGTKPTWDSISWIQKEFMQWFNKERLRTIMAFPVESFALIYKDGKFLDTGTAEFVAQEYARGHSFFTYISDTVDSLSSCCRLRNQIQTKEFNFTNGNMGVMTGSKSVITLNLSRIIQDWYSEKHTDEYTEEGKVKIKFDEHDMFSFKNYLLTILERVYRYHTAYNELLWDMYNANLLPIYSAGFINLDKQYLTIGINGLNQAAEFLNIECNDNSDYQYFCSSIFSYIKEQNLAHKTAHTTYNTECVPAEGLAIKNYNWDKAENYWVPSDTNLYASYIYKPNDNKISIIDKLILHGKRYIGEYLDGGSAAHLNLDSHLSVSQYRHLLNVAGKVGCQYFTFNIPNSECEDCGYITKIPVKECPNCGSKKIVLYDRVIGYLTKIKNWSTGRQIEQKTRVYENIKSEDI